MTSDASQGSAPDAPSSARGAIDLSGLQREAGVPSAAATGSGYSVDVTEANFQAEILNRSMSVAVVVYLWSARAEGIDQFTAVLEKLVAEKAGKLLLAKVDVDANQQIAMALQAQAIPTVIGFLRGQPVPLFQGAPAEDEIRGVFDQLLQAAVQNGVAGKVEPTVTTGTEEEPGDPRFDAAFEAINAGNLDQAAASYQEILAEAPSNADAKAGLANVELLRRTAGVDEAAVRASADQNPDDVDAQLVVADLDAASGKVEDAFARLIATVRRTQEDDRDRARGRLLELFEVVGPTDPRVIKARGQLANALF